MVSVHLEYGRLVYAVRCVLYAPSILSSNICIMSGVQCITVHTVEKVELLIVNGAKEKMPQRRLHRSIII